ncbi:MAG: xanthine dehydrogenase family protein molybdopterin-binding subunit [Burkholderiaceae bacterium]
MSSTPNAVTGKPLDRRDGPAKVTGTAAYAADQRVPGLLHAVLVTSTIASGRIAQLDASAAMKSQGVAYVLSRANAQRLPKDGKAAVNPPAGRVMTLFQDDAILYNGQPIAAVIADTLEHAKAGAEAVRVRYTGDDAVLDFANAKQSAYKPAKVQGRPADTSEGDVEGAIRNAGARIEAGYSTPFEHHNPMEPHATIASWEGDQLTLYDATQYVSGVKNTVSKTLGIDAKNVHVVCPFVGGGFGCKGSTWSHVVLAAMAAQKVKRPVKLVVERTQMWGPVGGRPLTEQAITLAAASDGRLVATKHAVVSHTSTFEDFVEPSALVSRMLYSSGTRATSHRLAKLNVGTPTFQRAPGEATGSFALESAIDEMAEKVGLDPLEMRIRNHADMSPDGKPWSSKSLFACYRLGAERFGWSRRNAKPGSLRDGNEWIGYGMGTATYPTNRSKASAKVTIAGDGVAVVQSGTQDLGTGTWTVMAQVAADALGFPLDRVRFELGDSAFPEAPVSGGSQSAASVSPAVQAACIEARQQLLLIATKDSASPLRGIAADDMTIVNGWFGSLSQPDRREPVASVMKRAGTAVVTQASSAPGKEKEQYEMHAFGAVFVEARVDADLCRVRIPRVVGAYAVGRRLNEKTANSQLMGGIVWGLSMALFEESLLDTRNGRYVNASLAEYHVPVNADVGSIDVLFVDEDDPHVNPLGVKGIGEIGITGVAGAIANAIYNATGRRVRDLPITLDKLMSA